MKHIGEFMEERQVSLFAPPAEKGGGEWKIFSSVRNDLAGSYRVSLPRQAIVVREPHHILRIVYPMRDTFALRTN